MKKYLLIEADTNDVDYISSKNEVSDKEIEEIRPVALAIKAFKPYKRLINGKEVYFSHNYNSGDSRRMYEFTPEELYGHIPGFELFDELRPHGEYGIHTITRIEIIEVLEKLL